MSEREIGKQEGSKVSTNNRNNMASIINEMSEKDPANEFLKQLAEDITKNPPTDTNEGHNKLMQDLTDVWKDAYDYQYHDFKNKRYPAPKVALRNRLLQLADNVVNGKYDN
jgi:hypothetical protein